MVFSLSDDESSEDETDQPAVNMTEPVLSGHAHRLALYLVCDDKAMQSQVDQ
jgi:hypothetical protein